MTGRSVCPPRPPPLGPQGTSQGAGLCASSSGVASASGTWSIPGYHLPGHEPEVPPITQPVLPFPAVQGDQAAGTGEFQCNGSRG